MIQNYVVVGAGGTASHLMHALVAYTSALPDDPFIHVWDKDSVELSNLQRQLFFGGDIGSLKAEVFEKRFPGIVKAHTEFIGPDNIESAIQEDDIVLICADNMFVRKLINDRAKQLQTVTIINGGNEMHSGSVQSFVKVGGKRVTPELEWMSPELEIDDGDRSAMSCDELAMLPGGEQLIISNMTTAALMMAALWRLHRGTYIADKQWTKVTYDHAAGTFQTSDVRLTGGIDV